MAASQLTFRTLPTKYVCWGKGLCEERQGTIVPSVRQPTLSDMQVCGEMDKRGVNCRKSAQHGSVVLLGC